MAYEIIRTLGKAVAVRNMENGVSTPLWSWDNGDWQQFVREELASLVADALPTLDERREQRRLSNQASYAAHMRAGAMTSAGFRVSMDWDAKSLQDNLAVIDREILPSLPARPADLTQEQWATLAQIDAYVVDLDGKTRKVNQAMVLQDFGVLQAKRLANVTALREASVALDAATTTEEITAATYSPIPFND